MYVLGLTGSIAMGKTWAAKCFRRLGVPVHDADATVHALMGPGGRATLQVGRAFPGVLNERGEIDRLELADRVFGGQASGLDTLEAILHPLVRDEQRRFLARHMRAATPLVVLDVPLLFETGGRGRVDAAVVVSAPAFLQRARALRRRGMTREKLAAVLARQMPDCLKRRAADFLVATGGPRGASLRRIAEIVKVAKTRRGRAWGPAWGR